MIDTIWGVSVADPYRWLETTDSDSTQIWLKQQKALIRKEKNRTDNAYMGVFDQTLDKGDIGFKTWVRKGPYYFRTGFSKAFRTKSPYKPMLFMMGEQFEDLVFDPNLYSTNDKLSIEDYSVSTNSRYVTISLSHSDADWKEIRVVDLQSTNNVPDKIKWVKLGTTCWWSSGFFYSRFKDVAETGLSGIKNEQQQVYYHQLGDKQEQDKLVYAVPPHGDKDFRFEMTPDNKHLVLYSVTKLKGVWCKTIAYKDLSEGIFSELKPLIISPEKDNIFYSVIDFINNKYVVRTTLDAPTGKVLLFNKDSVNKAEEVIPAFKEVLLNLNHFNHQLVGLYFEKKSGLQYLSTFSYEGKLLNQLHIDTGFRVSHITGTPDDSVVLYSKYSLYCPPVVFKLNLADKTERVFEETVVHFWPDKYISYIELYKSKDGTEIPMYLTHKKGLKLTGNNPVLLYASGGFEPYKSLFGTSYIMLYENDGILAVPLIRGSLTMGETWQRAGTGLNRQISFDDFATAAEHLVAKGYTTKNHLAIMGGYDGALLTQRPDLFNVAVGAMGIYDMARFNLFPGGRYWTNQYGDVNDSVECINMLKYSPLHQLKDNTDYPATVLIANENNDHSPDIHSYKFIAALQAKSKNLKPHLLFVEGGWKDSITSDAFALSFIFRQFGLSMKTGF